MIETVRAEIAYRDASGLCSNRLEAGPSSPAFPRSAFRPSEAPPKLSFLQPQMRKPIVWSWTRVFDPPSRNVHTLILQNVATLSAADQRRLLAWIGRDGYRTQVISTSEHPLFAAVTRGVFEEALYYRLNVILLRIDPTNLSALPAE